MRTTQIHENIKFYRKLGNGCCSLELFRWFCHTDKSKQTQNRAPELGWRVYACIRATIVLSICLLHAFWMIVCCVHHNYSNSLLRCTQSQRLLRLRNRKLFAQHHSIRWLQTLTKIKIHFICMLTWANVKLKPFPTHCVWINWIRNTQSTELMVFLRLTIQISRQIFTFQWVVLVCKHLNQAKHDVKWKSFHFSGGQSVCVCEYAWHHTAQQTRMHSKWIIFSHNAVTCQFWCLIVLLECDQLLLLWWDVIWWAPTLELISQLWLM